MKRNPVSNDKLLLDTVSRLGGEGIWRVRSSGDWPDLVLEPEDRQHIFNAAAKQFAEWVFEGTVDAIHHRNDPPWDHSGELVKITSTPTERLALYDTLEAWMEEAHTGNSSASFESGYGLSYETFHAKIDRLVMNELTALWTRGLSEAQRELMFDQDPWEDTVDVQIALGLLVGQMSVPEAWTRGQAAARAALAIEEAETEIEHTRVERCRMLAKEFWNKYFRNFSERFIDKPTAHDIGFFDHLRRALADAKPETVYAIIQVGLPGDFSNRVSQMIQAEANAVFSGETEKP